MEALEMHKVVKAKVIKAIVDDLSKQYTPQMLESVKVIVDATLDIYRRTYDNELEEDLKNG